jgi:hypothetical protein
MGASMKFDTVKDAVAYVVENNLWNEPVSLDFHFHKKPKIEVWYGNFETGLFKKGKDEYCMTIIHDITEKVMMEDDTDAIENRLRLHDSYLIPSQWAFEIVYSSQYLKDNAL